MKVRGELGHLHVQTLNLLLGFALGKAGKQRMDGDANVKSESLRVPHDD